MKIFHLSDLHIGKRVNDFPMIGCFLFRRLAEFYSDGWPIFIPMIGCLDRRNFKKKITYQIFGRKAGFGKLSCFAWVSCHARGIISRV